MTARLIFTWLCNIVDIAATLYLCNNNYAKEINPFMAILLSCPVLFVVVKIALVTLVLLWLWHERNNAYAVLGSYIVVFVYGVLALYYIAFMTLIR